jgi:tetratricopeptide (TPR) repeat protein
MNGILVYILALVTFKHFFIIQNQSGCQTPDHFVLSMALFAACIFIAHPLQTQSVTYIVQRMNSMATMFYLFSLLFFILGRQTKQNRKRWLFWTGCLGSWILALCSKQIAATLPIIILLYEWYFFQDLGKEWIKKNSKYFFGLVLLLLLISFIYLGGKPLERILVDYNMRDFTMGERILTQFRVLVYYISLLFYPHPSRLNLLHEFSVSHSFLVPVTTIYALFFLTGLLSVAIYFARRQRLISFCILWFFFNLIIESSVIGLELIFEHRLYLPMFGYALVISYLVFSSLQGKPVLILVCSVIVIILLGAGTYTRNGNWADEIDLWSDVLTKNPQSYRAEVNLGNALRHRGLTEDSIIHYRKALAIYPYYSKAHNNLGMALKSLGKRSEGIVHYNLAIKYDPSNAKAHYNLGIAFTELGRLEEAIGHYSRALKIDPYYTKAHYNLGNVYGRREELEEATYHYKKAIEQEPGSAHGYNNLGIILAHQGNIDDAIGQFTEAIRINPQYINSYFNLGKAQLLKGDIKSACSYFHRVFSMKSDFQNVREILALNCGSR